ncbi:MAG: hypothetical protein SXV54_25765 [Chloroflexota bacterium]|nr:hypothetical protein [Chloroflexota bacterium]
MAVFQARLKRVLWVAIAMGIVARLLLPWLSLSFLLEYVVSDDAFYYFTIARNVVHGLGVTFDGLTPTNGFHPLWLICLLPIYAVAGGDAELALRLSLALGSLFSVGAVLLLGLAVARWMRNPMAGRLASALFALNLYAVIEGVNGLETSLALLLLSIVLLLLARWQEGGAAHGSLWLGVASGALVWARSDMALVLVGLYAYLLLSRRARFWSLAGATSVAGLMIVLWLAWSWVAVGTPVQSSGVAIPWITRARMEDAITGGWMTPAMVTGRVWQHFVQTTLYQMLNYAGVGLVAGLIVLLVRVREARLSPKDMVYMVAGLPGWLWWGGAGTLVMLLLSEFVRFSLREWYIAPLSLWCSVFGAGLLAGWAAAPRMRTRRSFVVACVVLGLLAGGQVWRDLGQHGRYWFQLDQLAAARWIATNTPEDDVVGSWTAGIYGYFARRRVVNLDGVVNWDAVHAYQARDLYGYMRGQHIRWLVDFDQFVEDFTNFYGADPASFLTPAHVFEGARAPFGRLVVYEVEP